MKKSVAAILTILSLFAFFVLAGYFYYQPGFVYAVSVNGQDIGAVSNPDEYTGVLAELLEVEEEKTGLNLGFAEEVSARREFQLQPEPDAEQVEARLKNLTTFKATSCAVLIDGEVRFFVDTEDTAQLALETAKAQFVGNGDNVQTVSVQEDIRFIEQVVDPDQVIEADQAVSLLIQGRETVDTYTVQRGDNLWAISRSANVSEASLKEANPDLKETNVVYEGQELNLVTAEPLISVRVVETETKDESIPFTTTYRNSDNVWYYSQRVGQPGVNGTKQITYEVEYVNGREVGRTVVDSKVVSEPQNRIIERGTSRWPSGGRGAFRWPLNTGRITDRFGAFQSWRATRHSGVDIGAPAGTPIYAAASGTVVASTYNNSYGYMVVIRHSNGYFTLYAHMQARSSLSVGQSVSSGQMIGRVGSTGQSTGPHLHFETRRPASTWNQATPVDPLQFFNP
ncbi:MAG: LysM peptidoglycan-binding domain-containing protein [Firmicutes bacterium]|nr:LysM peptidoglycan-binding domain-containing protein [Bacillota bacterium]